MKRKIQFKDKEKNIFNLEIEILEGRLSISGDSGCGCGQIIDEIVPKNEYQEKLVNIWKTWHLNDMKAGTEEQEEAINKWKEQDNKYDYDKVCEYLKSINLYEVKHPTKKGKYKYGHEWLKKDLPSNIEEEVNNICDKILELEQEEKEITVQEALKQEIDLSNYDDKIIALALNLNLSTNELEEIEENGNCQFTYGGICYYVGEYEELEEIARDYLTDDKYLWQSAVEAGNTELGLDEWADMVIDNDGIGSILNRWNGEEDNQEYNGINYIICRQ